MNRVSTPDLLKTQLYKGARSPESLPSEKLIAFNMREPTPTVIDSAA